MFHCAINVAQETFLETGVYNVIFAKETFQSCYCHYIMISVHRQSIIVDSHFHFTQHSCFRPGPPNFGTVTTTFH